MSTKLDGNEVLTVKGVIQVEGGEMYWCSNGEVLYGAGAGVNDPNEPITVVKIWPGAIIRLELSNGEVVSVTPVEESVDVVPNAQVNAHATP